MIRGFYTWLIFPIILALAFGISPVRLFAQTTGTTNDLQVQPGETDAQHQARLQNELAQVLQEEQNAQNTLTQTQAQSASLQRDIAVLDGQITVAQLNIQAKNLLIATLGKNISDKQQTIDDLTAQINKGRDTLAQLMRKTNEIDSVSIPEVVLSGQNLTTVLGDLDTFGSVEASLKSTFGQIRTDQSQTQSEKDQLTTRQNQEIDAKAAILQDQKNIQTAEANKKVLLASSKNSEKTYASVLAQKAAQAAQIRAALFALRDTQAIPFGDALKYAQIASRATNVRPAFLLAILTQESALGANVGTCYVTNMQTGAGVGTKNGQVISNVMKPGRDTTPFLSITSQLGLDPYKTLVSCPQSVGWGGAMGPAQFIPSTWQLFAPRIASALGETIVNPWNPQDAFMASAIYLGDLGAINGSYTGEKNAACKYYSGSSCSRSSLVNSYGVSVLSKASTIQTTMIDPLAGL